MPVIVDVYIHAELQPFPSPLAIVQLAGGARESHAHSAVMKLLFPVLLKYVLLALFPTCYCGVFVLPVLLCVLMPSSSSSFTQ